MDMVFTALRASGNPDAVTFIQKYDSLSLSDRKMLTIEEVAVAAAIPTPQLLAVAVLALVSYGNSVGEIIASTTHPLVVKKTVQMALHDAGTKDREMLHLNRGFVPAPRGATMVSKIQIANLTTPDAPVREVEVDGDLPEMDDFIKQVHEIRVGNLLGDGKV